MIHFIRYPYVKDLITHYANEMNEPPILLMLEQGINSENEATDFAQFIWRIVDQMRADSQNGISVLGRLDNTDTMPDIDCEVSLFLGNYGYAEIWDQVCDKQ